ncbi:MAG: type II secretion system F family protein [Chloroflexi bacterium]|nr:type II secretion system F family protein [Chloroflexota bacterium]
MAIEYVAYNEAGNIVAGALEVESSERALEALSAANLVVFSLKKQRRLPSLSELMPTLFGVKPSDVITFTRELDSLLSSGITLLSSLRVLYEVTEKKAFKEVIHSVMREVESGNSFSQACSKQPSVFLPFYIRLLQVAEGTGELTKILADIVIHMEKQKALLSKIRRATTYPAIVLAVGIVAAVILTTVALPALTALLAEYRAKMPISTRILIGFGDFSKAYGKYVLGFVVVLALFVWRYIKTSSGEKRWHRSILKIPVIGRIIYNSQMARLCSSLATLLGGGLSTSEAIRLSIEASDNASFQEGLTGVYREVLTGSRLEPAIIKQNFFPRLFSQTVGIGEETGSLRVNLSGLATFYEQETDRVTARATDLIEPIMILIIGVIVGFIGVAIISAIYGMISQIR